MKINANASGTRTIEVNEQMFLTVKKYSLFERIANSIGIVDEDILEKLRCTVRSLIASQEEDSKALLELALVLYNDNMKALGLSNLIAAYNSWLVEQPTEEEKTETCNE
ncbi:MAG: hypothetical protein IKJ31_01495 [Bacteroidaceae bacterium]|nr:hypothetical protein [Bacteroidaceae bacterium]